MEQDPDMTELAQKIYLAWMRDERWGNKLIQDPTRGTDRRPIGYFWAEVAARAVLKRTDGQST
jgi:hypothetical protein